jgi:two-component system chemotaxis response regulator CheB
MEFLIHVLNSDPQLRVVGTALDGEEAVAAAQRFKPDVITMDIHMPKVNGFDATRSIMETCPTPVVIVSGSSSIDEVATNFRAIEAGALAVVARPSGIGHPTHESTAKELVGTVKLMSEVKVVKRWSRYARTAASIPHRETVPMPSAASPPRVVAIGASTGGPLALQTIFAGLSKDFPLPVLVVQHMSPGFAQGFVEWLSHSTRFPIRVAVQGEALCAGQAYLAPDDFHMGLKDANHILLARGERENGMRPSASFLFRSVKAAFGPNAIGVLLTGMGIDGAEELKRLKDAGAFTIAQDEESSVVHGMPGQAIKIGAARQVLPPEGIARALTAIVAKS